MCFIAMQGNKMATTDFVESLSLIASPPVNLAFYNSMTACLFRVFALDLF